MLVDLNMLAPKLIEEPFLVEVTVNLSDAPAYAFSTAPGNIKFLDPFSAPCSTMKPARVDSPLELLFNVPNTLLLN